MSELKAKPGCCEEAHPASHDFYIPCNAPATCEVFHARDERSYRMCEPCGWHNTKNRGGVYVNSKEQAK